MALNIKPFYPLDHPAQTSAMLAMWAKELESQCSIGMTNLKGQKWDSSYEKIETLFAKNENDDEDIEKEIEWEEEKEILIKQLDCF